MSTFIDLASLQLADEQSQRFQGTTHKLALNPALNKCQILCVEKSIMKYVENLKNRKAAVRT